MRIQKNGYDSRIPIVIGVTGHRDLRTEDRQMLEKKVHEILAEIKQRCSSSPIILLSPLAEGADRLVAKVALGLDFKLLCPLPMAIEEYQKDFTSPESIAEFKQLLSSAEGHFELSMVEGNTIENIREKGISRDKQYEQVGAYIAKYSHILVALWDGENSKKMAGTSRIVKFRLEGIPEPYVPASGLLYPVDAGPVYQVVTPRICNPMPREKAFSVRKYYPDSSDNYGRIEGKHEKILLGIEGYNYDVIQLEPRVAQAHKSNKSAIITDDDAESLPADAKLILNHYTVADTLAQYFQKKSRQALIGLLVLVVLAILFFQIYLEFFKQPLVLFLYPATLGLAFSWYFLALRRGYQIKHIDYRAIAEGQRVQFFWNLAGLNDETAEYYLRKQKSELDWIRYAICSCNMLTRYFNKKEHVVKSGKKLSYYNIIIDHWVNDQRNYYARATSRDKKKVKKYEKMSTLFYWTGLGLACLMLLIHAHLHHVEFISHIMVVSISMSIAIAVAIQGYIEKAAFEEHIRQYSRLAHLYDKAAKYLTVFLENKNVFEARNLLRDLGKEALMENGDWVHLHRSRPIEVPKG